MVFQNSDTSTETENVLHKSVNCNLERNRSFKFDLGCQKVLSFQKLARYPHQGNIPYRPLCCDEGVYRIGREIQLLRPDEFKNIFLGMGGFHTKKIVLVCLGKYLEKSGIKKVFEITETFGPDTVKSVLNGGHYIRAKKGMYIFLWF